MIFSQFVEKKDTPEVTKTPVIRLSRLGPLHGAAPRTTARSQWAASCLMTTSLQAGTSQLPVQKN